MERIAWRSAMKSERGAVLRRALLQKTGGYCWRMYFKVLEVLFLVSVSQAFLPSKKAYGTHHFGTFEFANSIRAFLIRSWLAGSGALAGYCAA
jgi:hypothetical protein